MDDGMNLNKMEQNGISREFSFSQFANLLKPFLFDEGKFLEGRK